jgi:hypothetical protein
MAQEICHADWLNLCYDRNQFAIPDERRAGKFSRRATGVVPAVSHRRVQQLRVSAAKHVRSPEMTC